MTDFALARKYMVDSQLLTSAVTDRRILNRMGELPREKFLPASRQSTAYVDDVQWFGQPGSSRFVAPPAVFGKLLQLAEITHEDVVLDIGAATGYSTAVIAALAASVDGFEPDAELARQAAANIADLDNATVVNVIESGRYDVVIVEGALEKVPDVYFAALKDGGRLIALIREGAVAVANVFVKTGKDVAARQEFNAMLPPLVVTPHEDQFVF